MMRPPVAKSATADQPRAGRELYWQTRWIKFRLLLLVRNPICSRIINGEQCHNRATVGHHLVSPLDNPALTFVTSNIVMLCASCHPNTRGTAQWIEGKDFVKTIGYGG
jgi:hypothetical protein